MVRVLRCITAMLDKKGVVRVPAHLIEPIAEWARQHDREFHDVVKRMIEKEWEHMKAGERIFQDPPAPASADRSPPPFARRGGKARKS